jgi:predicted nucleic acid-binding protein
LIVYVDTSALLKRVFDESETVAVADALRVHAARRDLLTSSSLSWVEVWRALRRASRFIPGLVTEAWASDALSGIAELPLTSEVLASARSVGSDVLRSLDAIHLAAALAIDANIVMTFDDRLAAAAEASGLTVLAPAGLRRGTD